MSQARSNITVNIGNSIAEVTSVRELDELEKIEVYVASTAAVRFADAMHDLAHWEYRVAEVLRKMSEENTISIILGDCDFDLEDLLDEFEKRMREAEELRDLLKVIMDVEDDD